ncbi:hypothetical protein F5Y19DRAFT_431546 [Xylariaceae sp. FL1651]|nr:hypothetical protein F5Y19DRAFT_431546 [Xylariaceae sp. FL1651]
MANESMKQTRSTDEGGPTPPIYQTSTCSYNQQCKLVESSSCHHIRVFHSDKPNNSQDEAEKAYNHSDADFFTPGACSRRIPVLESLGISGCLAIAGGSVVVLAIVAFLIFLWAGIGPLPGGEQALPGWRTIMLNGWATRSVTISSLVLRTATAVQTGVCTSLIAGLFLERGQVPMSQSAHLSLSRGISSSPGALLGRITFTRSRINLKGIRPEWIMLVLLAATSIILQFSSTILLSCFGTTSLVGYPLSQKVNMGISADRAALITQFITDDSGSLGDGGPSDNTFAVFGILQPNATPIDGTGLSDTGLKRHAFLPFDQGNRSNILSFEGPSLVTNTRVSCLRPIVSATFGVPNVEGFNTHAIYGNISYEETFQAAGQIVPRTCKDAGNDTTACFPRGFMCAYVIADSELSASRGATFACSLQSNSKLNNSWDAQESPLDAESRSWPFLLFSTNIHGDFGDDRSIQFPLEPSTPYNEWSGYSIQPGHFFNMTLCFVGYNTAISYVDMSRQTDTFIEPTVATTIFGNDTGIQEVEAMFERSDTTTNNNEAGLLSISDIDETKLDSQTISTTLDILYVLGLQSLFTQMHESNASLFLCVYCNGLGIQIPTDLQRLFNDMISSGARASLAFEALLTVYTQRVYYFAQPGFDITGNVDVVFSSGYDVPKNWIGLKVVVVLILVQLLCVWLIALLFVTKANFTRQGNIWHTVSQLVSPDSAMVLSQSHEVKDREVTKMLKHHDPIVTITQSPNTGTVGLTVVRDIDTTRP